MTFEYAECDEHGTRCSHAGLSDPLPPGSVVGSWMTFAASAPAPPAIVLTSIEREQPTGLAAPDPSETENTL